MTATYDPTLSTPKDRMRLALGDTNVSSTAVALFSDEEYVAEYTRWGELLATANLADSLAALYAHKPDMVEFGGRKGQWRNRVTALQELSKTLRNRANMTTIGVSVLSTTAPIASPTGWPDANSGAYYGDPNIRSRGQRGSW